MNALAGALAPPRVSYSAGSNPQRPPTSGISRITHKNQPSFPPLPQPPHQLLPFRILLKNPAPGV